MMRVSLRRLPKAQRNSSFEMLPAKSKKDKESEKYHHKYGTRGFPSNGSVLNRADGDNLKLRLRPFGDVFLPVM